MKKSLQNSKLVPDDYEIKHTLLRQPFEWQPKISEVQLGKGNSTKKQICRNSVQGRSLIVDERGEKFVQLQVVTNVCTCTGKHEK